MRTFGLSLFFVLSACLCVYSQETMRVESKMFQSPDFPFDREIFIATPPYYDEYDQSDVDVVYVFDSQWRSHFALTYGILAECQTPGTDTLPFIVVGVPSPSVPGYCRSNDFLPEPTNVTYTSGLYGNYENFKKFLRDDVMPYIDRNYRTSGHTMAIGHSLSASFILNALASDELFDDYIALSPNFMEDGNKFADNFLSYDFNNGKPRFLFLSMTNESEDTGWPAEWRKAWDLVKGKTESSDLPETAKMIFKEYPHQTHGGCYAECLMDALPLYALYRQNTQFRDPEHHPVHIELECTWADGDVFITGNQDAVANWNPQGVKMNRPDDNRYSIDLDVRLPLEFKFTMGSWESQIYPGNAYAGNLRIFTADKANKHYRSK